MMRQLFQIEGPRVELRKKQIPSARVARVAPSQLKSNVLINI
jgi:hypothetical protein